MAKPLPLVLVVEDRPAISSFLRALLESLGATLEITDNLPDAMNRVERLKEQPNHYALLLMDVMFPAISPDSDDPLPVDYNVRSERAGIDLAKHVRRDLGIGREVLPIVFFTIRNDDEMKDEARELHAYLFPKDPERRAAERFRDAIAAILRGESPPEQR